MKSLTRLLTVSSVIVLLAPFASAQSATLNCSDYGVPTLVTPLYAYNVNTDLSNSVFDATVFIDVSFFPTLLPRESSYFSNCTITTKGLTISMDYASIVDVSATGGMEGIQSPGGRYTSVIFAFPTITVNGVTKSLDTEINAEAKAKAVAASRSQSLAVTKAISER
jgi:hypothetical protein